MPSNPRFTVPTKGARLAPPRGPERAPGIPRDAAAERDAWLDAFADKLVRLGVRGGPYFIHDIARQLHDTQSHLDPSDVAQSQWDDWPPEEH